MVNTKEFYTDREPWRSVNQEHKRFQRVAKFVGVGSQDRVLDIGCRDGKFKEYLPEDIFYRGIDIVDGFGREDILIQDVNKGIKLESNLFDYVFCIDLLEHIHNIKYVLDEIHRVLKPGGLLVLSVPNPYHFKEILWNLFKVKDKQGHLFSWTRQTMERLCGFCGFELVDTSGTYLIPAIGCGNILARSTIFKFKKVENA